jgi:hypothetical protein
VQGPSAPPAAHSGVDLEELRRTFSDVTAGAVTLESTVPVVMAPAEVRSRLTEALRERRERIAAEAEARAAIERVQSAVAAAETRRRAIDTQLEQLSEPLRAWAQAGATGPRPTSSTGATKTAKAVHVELVELDMTIAALGAALPSLQAAAEQAAEATTRAVANVHSLALEVVAAQANELIERFAQHMRASVPQRHQIAAYLNVLDERRWRERATGQLSMGVPVIELADLHEMRSRFVDSTKFHDANGKAIDAQITLLEAELEALKTDDKDMH